MWLLIVLGCGEGAETGSSAEASGVRLEAVRDHCASNEDFYLERGPTGTIAGRALLCSPVDAASLGSAEGLSSLCTDLPDALWGDAGEAVWIECESFDWQVGWVEVQWLVQ